MKSAYMLLALIIMVCFNVAFAEEYETTFEWMFPKPQGGAINDIALKSSELFITGNSGMLMKSLDDGKNWIQLNNRESKNFKLIYFIDNRVGFLITDDSKVYRSIDGGNRWYIVGSYPNTIIHKILFSDSQTGWIIAENKSDQEWNILLKTENAGSTWERIDLQSFLPDADEYADVFDMFYLDSLNGWIASWNAIYRTYDGGFTWQILNDKLRWFELLHFNDDKNGWCIRERKLYNTSDGGINWTELQTSMKLEQFYPVSTSHLYVKSNDDRWFNSFDAGKTWDTLKISDEYYSDIKKIAFKDNTNGYAIARYLYRTSDGGKNWTRLVDEKINGIQHMKMYSDKIGFLISWDDLIYSTTNGGESWLQRSSKTDFVPWTFSGELKCLHAFDENNIWAFNSSNQLGLSSNGGALWTINNEFRAFFPRFRRIQFINPTHGWIVGSSGTLINTTDGGKKWISRELPTRNEFIDVSFVNENYGWVLDRAGKVFYTTNGGTSWDNRNIDPNYKKDFVSIEFDDINNGRILAEDAFYLSNNGGLSWRKSDLSEYGMRLRASSFVNDFGIIVATDNGYDRSTNSILLYTTDYGRTWSKLTEAPQSDYVKLFKDNTFLLGRASYSLGLMKYNLKVKTMMSDPLLLVPPDNAKKIEPQTKLECRSYDNVYYEFMVSTDADFQDLLLNEISTTNSIAYNQFDIQMKYYWRVRLLSWDEVGPWSSRWSFNTKLPVPALVSPSVNAEVTTPNVELRWTTIHNVDAYLLQLSPNINFSQLEFNRVVNGNSETFSNLANNRLYYWRVLAIGANDSSAWSEVGNFRTKFESTNVEEINNSKFISFNQSEKYLVIKDDSDFYNELQIYDLRGNMIQSGLIHSTNQLINLQGFINGIYFVKYKNEYFILFIIN